LGRLLVFGVLAFVCISISLFTPLRQFLSIEVIREFSGKLGVWGPVVLVLLGAFGPLLFLPRWPICFVGGMLYGILWGSIIGNVAGLLGCWVHYGTSRFLVSTSSDQLLRKFHMDAAKLRRNPFWVIFILRAVPISNSAMTNVLAGALKISVSSYLVSSFLGMIPSSIMYASWGKLMKKRDPGLFILALGILLAMMFGAVLARRYVFRKADGCSQDTR